MTFVGAQQYIVQGTQTFVLLCTFCQLSCVHQSALCVASMLRLASAANAMRPTSTAVGCALGRALLRPAPRPLSSKPSLSGHSLVDPYNSHMLTKALQLGSFSDHDIDAAFDRLDQDGDGKLSIDELHVLFKDYGQRREMSDEEIQTMTNEFMAGWDDDSSKSLSREEFKQHAVSLGSELHPAAYQLAAGMALTALPFGILVPFEPQLVSHLGISAAGFGASQSAFFLSNVVCNIPMTEVVAKRGSKPVFVASLVVLGASMGAVSLVGSLEQLIACVHGIPTRAPYRAPPALLASADRLRGARSSPTLAGAGWSAASRSRASSRRSWRASCASARRSRARATWRCSRRRATPAWPWVPLRAASSAARSRCRPRVRLSAAG